MASPTFSNYVRAPIKWGISVHKILPFFLNFKTFRIYLQIHKVATQVVYLNMDINPFLNMCNLCRYTYMPGFCRPSHYILESSKFVTPINMLVSSGSDMTILYLPCNYTGMATETNLVHRDKTYFAILPKFC